MSKDDLISWAYDRLVNGKSFVFRHEPIMSFKKSLYETITEKYCEPHRTYHNLAHIKQCIDDLELIEEYFEGPKGKDSLAALELAIWFHDIIYDNLLTMAIPGANETASARLLELTFKDPATIGYLYQGETTLKEASFLIECTNYYETGNKPEYLMTENEKIMRDIDMAGFATEDFDQYMVLQSQVEQESLAERMIYISNRYRWLKTLKINRGIYLHKLFNSRNSWAKHNITKEIDILKEQLGDAVKGFEK
jgi:predicted metal-dependent HD superfamily phosphohydrolase